MVILAGCVLEGMAMFLGDVLGVRASKFDRYGEQMLGQVENRNYAIIPCDRETS
jgi:hypothetical protein